MLSLSNLLTPCYSFPSPPTLRPQCVMFPSLCPCVLIVQHPFMSENMWCLVFCSSVSLLTVMASSFIHVPAKDMNSSFFMAAYYSMVYMSHIFFFQSIIDGYLGWFQVFAIVKSATINICVHVYFMIKWYIILWVMGLLGQMVFLFLDLWGIATLSSTMVELIYVPTNSVKVSLFLCILSSICCLLIF